MHVSIELSFETQTRHLKTPDFGTLAPPESRLPANESALPIPTIYPRDSWRYFRSERENLEKDSRSWADEILDIVHYDR